MEWFKETLHDGFSANYAIKKILYHNQTQHQNLIIFENPVFGRVMALDGVVQTTERDEFIYHEMFAHVPLFTHPNPKNVLIVGGGDGGLLREVVKHQGIEKITMVEIDDAVVELSKEFLPGHSQGSFNDPRLDLVINDGLEYMKTCELKFDVILSDSTDPIGPGAALFEEQFYKLCAQCLTESGIIVTQNGVSFLQTEELVVTKARMQPYFARASFYQADVPTYVAGNMNFAWGQMSEFKDINEQLIANKLNASKIVTRYFTPELYFSAFNLPKYLLAAINGEKYASV